MQALIFRALTYLLVLLPLFIRANDAETLAKRVMELSREEVERKLATFDGSLLDYRVDDVVYRRIVNYIENWPISSGRMLARSARFYPIFEEQIQAAGLPDDIKHLSIVESALRSWAVSPVGAGGLWQLMPGTARELGLIINDELDERMDPTLGCAAGLEYLRLQHAYFDDWALALAAYNSGPGKVRRAIRRSGSRDFWKLRRFLPRETRNYVPNFIAAVFLLNYHHRYGLPATKIPLDDQLTGRVLVYRRMSLHRVAQITGLSPYVVLEQNPQYTKGYLPGLPGGHFLQLPERVIPAMVEYLKKHPYDAAETETYLPWSHPLLADGELNGDRYYRAEALPARVGDTLARQVADRHEVALDRLLVWSERGEVEKLTPWDTLTYYTVAEYQPYDPRLRKTPAPAPFVEGGGPLPLRKSYRAYLGALPTPMRRVEDNENWWQSVKAWLPNLQQGGGASRK